MCLGCGYPMASGHWSEAGSQPGTLRRGGQDPLLTMLAQLLSADGLAVRRGRTGFILVTPSGRSAQAATLDDVWAASRALTGRSLDPLGPRFLPAGPTAA